MRNGRTVSIAETLGVPVSTLDPVLEAWVLVGAEDPPGGEGSGEGEGGSGGEGTQQQDPPPGEEGEGEGEGESKTYDEAYVKKLREEAAANRVKAKEAEEKLKEKEKAEMNELERAQTERDEEKAKREAAESELSRLRMSNAIERAAVAANFHDPEDAMSMIDVSSISTNDEGEPNRQSVEAAVKRLADSKPHLVKPTGPGSGDGGSRGTGPATVEERQKQYAETFQQRGGVPKPK